MMKKNLFALFCVIGVMASYRVNAVILSKMSAFDNNQQNDEAKKEIKKDETENVVNFFKGLNLMPALAKLIKEGGVLVVNAQGVSAGVYTQKTPQELNNMNKAIQKVFFGKGA